MSDIVERLRSPANVFYEYEADNGAFLRKAADEITRLRAENEKLNVALEGYREDARNFLVRLDELNALRAENEKLREERQELKNELAKWVNCWRDKDVKALSADIHGLREALEPFARLSDRIPPDYEDDRPDVTITLEKVPVKVIRAAAAALGKSNDED